MFSLTNTRVASVVRTTCASSSCKYLVLAHSFSTSPQLLRNSQSSQESSIYRGLYYHPIDPNTSKEVKERYSYSLSFLPEKPPSLSFSPTTIGLISNKNVSARPSSTSSSSNESRTVPSPSEADSNSLPRVTPRNFVANNEFETVLHDILKDCVGANDYLQTMAKTRNGDGWIHITDLRTPIDPSRVPDPSDILASLLVQDGSFDPKSYQPSGTHRLVTIDGMMKLEPSLMKQLKEKLKTVREVEVQIAKEAAATDSKA